MSGILPDDMGDPVARARWQLEKEQEQREAEAAAAAEALAEEDRARLGAGLMDVLGDTLKEEIDAHVAEIAAASKSMGDDIPEFRQWCRDEGREFLPSHAEDVANYLFTLPAKGQSPDRAAKSIGKMHELFNHSD